MKHTGEVLFLIFCWIALAVFLFNYPQIDQIFKPNPNVHKFTVTIESR